MGHLQVVTGLSDQLYRSAWGVLGEFWGRWAVRELVTPVGTMVPSIRVVPTLKIRALQTTNGGPSDKTRDHGTHWYNEISNRPPPLELPKNAPRIPV